MDKRQLTISYAVCSSLEELSLSDRQLCEAALEARAGSYAPYSRFNVGAAVLLENGVIVKGSNQENAASPSSLCAERTALYSASATYPGVDMLAIAVCGGPDQSLTEIPVTPCGACRQVMAEYQSLAKNKMKVFLVGSSQIWCYDKVEDILPFIFDSYKP